MADVGGHAFELEGLEARPAEEGGVLGGEAAEELCDVLFRVVGADGLLLGRGDLCDGVLADGLVGRPMLLLAFRGLSTSISPTSGKGKREKGITLTQ